MCPLPAAEGPLAVLCHALPPDLGCALLLRPRCAMPCHVMPCFWPYSAMPCHVVPRSAVPRCRITVVPFHVVPCHAVPPPAGCAHPHLLTSLPSAASSSGAAQPPATLLIITGHGGGCSPQRWTNRRCRASGNTGLLPPRAASNQHGCARVCCLLHACVRACSVPRQRDEGLQALLAVVEGPAAVGWEEEGLQSWASRFVLLPCKGLLCGCARFCSAGARVGEGLQCQCVVVPGFAASGWLEEGMQCQGSRM